MVKLVAFLRSRWFLGLTVLGLGSWPLLVQAVQLQDGKVYFVQPPRLSDTSITFPTVYSPNSVYYFTFQVPANAGEPLQQVLLDQQQGGETVRFNPGQTRAFAGTPDQSGAAIALGPVVAEGRRTSIRFNPAVSPGQVITLALQPDRNPGVSGIYLFGVTAFPQGENSSGQFLGYGRFTIRGRRGT